MVLGKYTRIDNRRPSSSWSTASIVVFVALCLVGIWMMTSSFIVPMQNVDVPQESKNVATAQVREDHTPQFNNNPGEFPGKGGKKDSDEETTGGEGTKTDGVGSLSDEEGNSEVGTKNEETTGGGGKKDDTEGSSQNKTSPGEQAQQEKKQGEKAKEKPEGKPSERDEEKAVGYQETIVEDGSKIKIKDGERKADSGDSKAENKETRIELGGTKIDGGESLSDEQGNSEVGTMNEETMGGRIEEKVEPNDRRVSDKSSSEKKETSQFKEGVFPSGPQSELLNENSAHDGAWSTQEVESKNEVKSNETAVYAYSWKLCNATAGPDYIPCLDNLHAIKNLRSTMHYEHRERHCPEEPPTCLVPLPNGYKQSVAWPKSREKIWFSNVPHPKLAEIKGDQNWVKVTGEYLTFPGGGTQFKRGAVPYIEFLQQSVPDIAWGKHTRVILDVGCGVASFGGFLFDRDSLTMSVAPKDEHEAQVQFALERGIPAISAVMGTKRLPYPGHVFDLVHCARCRVPWHIEGGKLLLELNRVLRPGGFFVWSATPVYRTNPEDSGIWKAMVELTQAMCWELVSINKDHVNRVASAMYRKPINNKCYEKRPQNEPPVCPELDDPNAAWNVELQPCIEHIPTNRSERGSQWPEQWPARLDKPPYWLLNSQVGVYGKPAPEDFTENYEHWKRVVTNSYLEGIGIDWSTVRNVMDMGAVYGGFAAALKDLNLWVMNVVPIDSPDTLPIIYERGLFGIYHDWCESFSTYPRSYDLLHASHLFSQIKKRCSILPLIAEVDRILRPDGKLIVQDLSDTIHEVENMVKSMRWKVVFSFVQGNERLLCVQKTMWRPKEYQTLDYAIA